MMRDQPATLPFVRPCPQPACDARRIFEITLPPSEFTRLITIDCTGPDKAVEEIQVRTFEIVG